MFETAALSYIVAGVISATLVTYGLIKLVMVFREAAEEDAAPEAVEALPLVKAADAAPVEHADGTSDDDDAPAMLDDTDDGDVSAGPEHDEQPAPAPSISPVGSDPGPEQWRHEFTAGELYESGAPSREPTLAEKKRKQVWAAWGQAWVTVGRGWRGQLVMFRSYQAAAAHGEWIMAEVLEERRTRALKAVEEHQAWIAWAAEQRVEAEAMAAREAEAAAAAMELPASYVPLALEMAPEPAVAWLDGLTELARSDSATAEQPEPTSEDAGSTDQPEVDEGVHGDAVEIHSADAAPQMPSVHIESLHVEVPHVESEYELPEQPPLLEDDLLAEPVAAEAMLTETTEDDETPTLAWLDGPATTNEAEELVEEAGSPGEVVADGVPGDSEQTEAAAASGSIVDEPVEPQEQPVTFEPVLVDTSIFDVDADAPPDQASEEDDSASLEPVAAEMLTVDVAGLEDVKVSYEADTAENGQDDEAVISWIVPVTEQEASGLPGQWDDFEEQVSEPEAETHTPATDLQLAHEMAEPDDEALAPGPFAESSTDGWDDMTSAPDDVFVRMPESANEVANSGKEDATPDDVPDLEVEDSAAVSATPVKMPVAELDQGNSADQSSTAAPEDTAESTATAQAEVDTPEDAERDADERESTPLSGARKSPVGRAERPAETGQFVPETYTQLDEYIDAGELSLATADLLPNLPGISVSYEYDPEEASGIKRRRQSDLQRLLRLVDDVPGPKVNAAVAYIEAAAAMRALLNLSLDRLKAGSLHAAASSAAKAIAWTRLLDRVCSQQGLDDRRPDQVRVWFLLAEIYAALDDVPVAAYALNHAEHYSLESGNDAWIERISDVRSRLQRRRFKTAA